MPIVQTPLRYPGGKTAFMPLLQSLIISNGLEGGVYAEPYAGGAGAAISLLLKGTVSKIYINDADRCIYSIWDSILNHTDEFIGLIRKTRISMRQWRMQREIYKRFPDYDSLQVGFATFFLNRCNRSGIISGGPIGGPQQSGNYKLNARYNKNDLIRKIKSIADLSSNIQISNLDAQDFLISIENNCDSNATFVYLDPPYYKQGRSLYMNHYQPEDHAALAAFMNSSAIDFWLLSYDDENFIRTLFSKYRMFNKSLKYSAQIKRNARELIIASPQLYVPRGLLAPINRNETASSLT